MLGAENFKKTKYTGSRDDDSYEQTCKFLYPSQPNPNSSIPCEECGKLFKVRSDLYSHAMTHKARKERIHRYVPI